MNVQNTTGAVGGIAVGPLVTFFWNMKFPDYPMDPVTASSVGSLCGMVFGSLLPELFGLLRRRGD